MKVVLSCGVPVMISDSMQRPQAIDLGIRAQAPFSFLEKP